MNEVIVNRFSECLDIEKIRAKVTVRPDPVVALDSFDAFIGSEQLANTLKQIFIPNEFSLAFIKEMVGRASVHSQLLFKSEAEYASKVFNPPDLEVSPVCLTGLAGVGKSQTITALRKVLPSPTDFSCDLYEGTVTLVSHWYASARGKASGKALLEDFVFGEDKRTGRTTVAQLLKESRRRANRDGVSLALLEEMQHTNAGSGAAKVTDILLTMAAIGLPMVFVCNYSLAHKLLGRNSEDKQRLLSDPRIMLPDDPGSADWRNYVDECSRVSNGYIKADAGELAVELYRCTFGIKRLVVLLLKLAYVECRKANRQWVNLLDITRAYRSAAYTASASEVEELQLQALSNHKKHTHKDLQCPFDLPDTMKSNVVDFTRADRSERVIATVFDSSLNEKERAAAREMEALGKDATQRVKPRHRVQVMNLTEEQKESAFREYMDNVAPPKPKRPK